MKYGIMSYNKDYYGWLRQQCQFIREKKIDNLDFKNILEELEGLARQLEIELENCKIRLAHTSSKNIIDINNIKIKKLLKESPSLSFSR